MKKFLFAGAALLLLSGIAVAQSVSLPGVVNVGPTDLFADVVGGAPTAQSKFATAAQINGVLGYHNLGTVTTDPAYAVPNGVTNIFAHASGTITLVTLTTEPNPADGKRECYWADQTTTTLTWTANTGQTITGNIHAAGVQYNSNCVTYIASTGVWTGSN